MKLLNKKKAARRAGLSVSTLKRLEASGGFPKRVQITVGRVGYVEDEVNNWIRARVAERDKSAA